VCYVSALDLSAFALRVPTFPQILEEEREGTCIAREEFFRCRSSIVYHVYHVNEITVASRLDLWTPSNTEISQSSNYARSGSI
jgi:hypothetical protein